MGIIFLGDPDYPDHRPLPSSFPSRMGMVAPVAVTLAAYALCPAHESHHAHGPHQEAPEGTSYPAWEFIASGSTSNSIVANRGIFALPDRAADAVIRVKPSVVVLGRNLRGRDA